MVECVTMNESLISQMCARLVSHVQLARSCSISSDSLADFQLCLFSTFTIKVLYEVAIA